MLRAIFPASALPWDDLLDLGPSCFFTTPHNFCSCHIGPLPVLGLCKAVSCLCIYAYKALSDWDIFSPLLYVWQTSSQDTPSLRCSLFQTLRTPVVPWAAFVLIIYLCYCAWYFYVSTKRGQPQGRDSVLIIFGFSEPSIRVQ